jgi:hypothetical protein
MRNNYNFNISLSVLNHLGRNLYRNVITVLGEAISNSWDADAKNVYITIDRENNYMSIQDDGMGMTDDDFQGKFLKIGYSKRKKGDYTSPSGRPFIGRKGIGKLALLSCAKRVSVATKANGYEVVGGIIDNSSLDKAITDDLVAQEYVLEPLKDESISKMSTVSQGTLIEFEAISDGIVNTVEYIKKAIALYFRFSLIDKEFKIHINGVLIDDALKEMLEGNSSSSTIKILVEAWYEKYIKNHPDVKYIEDTIYCGNRTISNYESSYFNPNGGSTSTSVRFNNNTKNLNCVKIYDQYSTFNNNAKIKYPVGLFTSQELNLLGTNLFKRYGSSFSFWTISPSIYSDYARTYSSWYQYLWESNQTWITNDDVKPVISLKYGTKYISGDGSKDNPYVVG